MEKTEIMTQLVSGGCVCVGAEKVKWNIGYRRLEHDFRFSRDNKTCELSRTLEMTWAAFWKLRNVLNRLYQSVWEKSLNQCADLWRKKIKFDETNSEENKNKTIIQNGKIYRRINFERPDNKYLNM